MHYRASWSSFSSTQVKWWAAIYYWLTDELCRSAAYFRFVSAFCFTCKRRWNKTEINQSRLKQTWNKFCFISVLFQFYFTCKSRLRPHRTMQSLELIFARIFSGHFYRYAITINHSILQTSTIKPETETKIRSAVCIENAKVLFLAQN